MKRAAVCIAVLLIIGLGLFWLANPLGFAMVYGSIFGYGHPTQPPDIARTIDLKWPNGGSEPNWTAILRRRFPAGSDETTLEVFLGNQGFKIDRQRKYAEFEWGGLPCTYTLGVVWKTGEPKKITWLNGTFSPACL